MEISLNLVPAGSWFGGDVHRIIELAGIADAMGIDAIGVPEHVVMGEDFSGYPYRPRIFTADSDFYEPMILLTAIAGRTRNIRLTTGVLLLPLRPAVLIAKQVATLDVISGGRVELSVGVGWQKAEYDFQGLPWEGRFGRMIEIVEACRLLWSEAPASYHGRYVDFTRAYSKPFPIQGAKLPILLGVGPSPVNIDRLARSADGWEPVGLPLDVVRDTLDLVHARLIDHGRDPTAFQLKLTLSPVRIDGRIDIDASLAQWPEFAAAGCTRVNINPGHFCASTEDYRAFISRLIEARNAGLA